MPEVILGAPDKQLYSQTTGEPFPLGTHLKRDPNTGYAEYVLAGEPVEIIPNIEMKFVVNFPNYAEPTPGDIGIVIFQTDDPASLPPNDGDNWSTRPGWAALITVNDTVASPADVFELLVLPTKKYLMGRLMCFTGTHDYGVYTFIGEYELIDMAIYRRLMKAKKVTLKQIEACDESVTEHNEAGAEAAAKKVELEDEMALFNYLGDEIAQYEALNPEP